MNKEVVMSKTWWKEAVVYQVYPKSFYDTNQDGYGDIKGVTQKIPYLSNLGINAIWLTPFFPSPMVDNGYDISDYMNVDPMFGTLEDFEELVNVAKQQGIKILVDLVLNHTSSQHPWFIEAKQSKVSPYRDFYYFESTKDGLPPNHWRSIFGGSAWEKLEDGSYYLHTFHKEQPDLNWENPKVRAELHKVLRFWMDKGVQGFRIDAITFIKKPKSFILETDEDTKGLRNIGKDTLNHPGIEDFLREMKEKTYQDADFLTVAEAPGVSYSDLEKYVSEDGVFSMNFDFSYIDIDLQEDGSWYPKKEWSIQAFKEKIFLCQKEYQKVGWIALFLESHDQPRSLDKFFPTQDTRYQGYYKATVLATMYFFMRGTPFIYQGQELGMRNYPFDSIEELDDISSIDQYHRALASGASKQEALESVNQRSRDHSRTPMLWTADKNAGFSTGKPWLPIHPNYTQINADRQIRQTMSVYKYYQSLIRLRKKENAYLVYGDLETVLENHQNIIAYKRVAESGDTMLILTNFSHEKQKFDMNLKEYVLILSNYKDTEICSEYTKNILRPYEAIVLKQEIKRDK